MKRIAVLMAALAFVVAPMVRADTWLFDWEKDDQFDEWEAIDEAPQNLGDPGPSTWEVRKSQLGLQGAALFQGSNIWGSAGDEMLMGTFFIYKGQEFLDFKIEVDVVAADNDGMGLVWGFQSTADHYRAIMINDRWPDPPVDGHSGPFLRMDKRISDDKPWYDLIDIIKPNDYTPYTEGGPLHWTLEVGRDGSFKFTKTNGEFVSGQDPSYKGGFVGIQLYAQQAEFDNFTIDAVLSVSPAGKVATTWGALKAR